MKYIIITILVIFCPLAIFAQQDTGRKMLAWTHHLYADVGTNSAFSLTYNYNAGRHWGWGGGVQGSSWNPRYTEDNRYMPGIFGDMHFCIRTKRNNQFFSFLDAGIDLYKREKRYYRDSVVLYDLSYTDGFYSAIGFGYLRRMTKRGGGVYVSVRFTFDFCRARVYSFISDDKNTTAVLGDATGVLSIGYKF